MSSAVESVDVAGAQSQLRLAHDPGDGGGHEQASRPLECPRPQENQPPERSTSTRGHAPVLVAGADAACRSAMLGELRNMLPESTRFVEAHEIWELLARAATSRMVVLTDDIGDISSASLVRLLGRRHPGLPVLAVEPRAPAGTSHDIGAASL